MNKKYNIILQEGWMGDTLWACNVVKNLSDMGYNIIMFHKWEFMKKLIDLFEINQNPSNINLDDYQKIIYLNRINHYENPLVDYINSFNIEGVDIKQASKFYSIKDKLNKERLIQEDYITYEIDWQNRTKLNVEYIINKLKTYINIIPIGGDRFTSDPNPLIESAKILSNSKLHLGMNGGTTHLAAFSGAKIICDSNYMYSHFSKGESPELFLENYKCFPNHWVDKKHVISHPNNTEDEFIKLVINNLN
jgi:hypothetical protein